MLEVIAGVDNDGQVFRRKILGKSVGKLGATDAAGKATIFN